MENQNDTHLKSLFVREILVGNRMHQIYSLIVSDWGKHLRVTKNLSSWASKNNYIHLSSKTTQDQHYSKSIPQQDFFPEIFRVFLWDNFPFSLNIHFVLNFIYIRMEVGAGRWSCREILPQIHTLMEMILST